MNSITDGYSFQTSWRKPPASDGGVRLGVKRILLKVAFFIASRLS